MMYHPAIYTLITSVLFMVYRNDKKILSYILVISPLLTGLIFTFSPDYLKINLHNFYIVVISNGANCFIAYAFLLVLLVANLFALAHDKKMELILGNTYGGFSLFCLLAGDYISFCVSLEIMMIFSTWIIFCGKKKDSFRCGQKYFLTHLLSSNMIIIGISYIIIKTGSAEITALTELFSNPEFSNIMLCILLTGLLINIATFPFSGWVMNYYPQSSTAGFLYLISFTTKVSLLALLKIFPGLDILKYIAIIMILLTAWRGLFEDKILKLVCYLSMMALGFMLLGVSYGSEGSLRATVGYLFIHILYKITLVTSIGTIIEHDKIEFCSKIKRINFGYSFFTGMMGIVVMIAVPFTTSFYSKVILSKLYSEDLVYFTILYFSYMIIFIIPWKKLLAKSEEVKIKLHFFEKCALTISSGALITVLILGDQFSLLKYLKNDALEVLSLQDILKQSGIILIGFLLALAYSFKRRITTPINFIEWTGVTFFYFHDKIMNYFSDPNNNDHEDTRRNTKPSIIKFIEDRYDQKISIFVIFTFMIILYINTC